MENNKELRLVYRSMETVSLSSPVNIMLTPQFYTLKKEVLPVKYMYQAKRIAPSLFEGLLEKEEVYDFFVFKEDEAWVFIAYDLKAITHFLRDKGFKDGDVSKIFFAQQSAKLFDRPCTLNEKEALVNLNETIVLVPIKALEDEISSSLNFGNRFTPKRGVSLAGSSNSIFTMRQAVLFSSVFIAFALMFFIEGLRYQEEGQSAEKELEALYSDYPALQSTYTRQGIVDKYRNTDKTERAKRDSVKKLSDMTFKGVTITSLGIDDKSVKATFSCSSAKIAKRVEGMAKKAQFSVSKTAGSDDIHIEGSL